MCKEDANIIIGAIQAITTVLVFLATGAVGLVRRCLIALLYGLLVVALGSAVSGIFAPCSAAPGTSAGPAQTPLPSPNLPSTALTPTRAGEADQVPPGEPQEPTAEPEKPTPTAKGGSVLECEGVTPVALISPEEMKDRAEESGRASYVVQEGENPYSIERKHELPQGSLQSVSDNLLAYPTMAERIGCIRAGWVLILPLSIDEAKRRLRQRKDSRIERRFVVNFDIRRLPPPPIQNYSHQPVKFV